MVTVKMLIFASIWLELGTQLHFQSPSDLQGCSMANLSKWAVKVGAPKFAKESAIRWEGFEVLTLL